ncbi:MAG: hypothetical protein U1E15_02745 [Hyphomicrobiales bacterium]
MTLASMIRALAGYVGARFLGAGLGLLTQLALARTLPPADVAVVLLAMSAAAFFSLLMNGGESQIAATHLPKLLALRENRAVAALHGFALRNLVFIWLGLALALAAAFAAGLMDQHLVMAGVAGLVASPMSALMRYNSMIANSERRFPLSYVPDFIVRPLLFLLILAGLFAMGWVRLVPLLAVFAGCVWAVALGQAVIMGRGGLLPRAWLQARRVFAARLRPRAFALLVVSLVAYSFADIVMLLAGFLLPPDEAAVAGVAVRLAAIAGFVLQASQLFVLPDFTEALAKKNDAAVNTVLWRVNTLTVVVIFAALIGSLLLGRFALSLFGAVYAEGATVLVLFLVAQSVRALGGMNQNLLSIQGFQLQTMRSCLVALVVLACVSALACRHFGMAGLGYGAIAAELAWLAGLAAQAQAFCGRRADMLWLARNT